jgi:hypothetical protein
MNKYEITAKIEDKFDLQDEETRELLLNTVLLASSEEDAVNQINSIYTVLEIITIFKKD